MKEFGRNYGESGMERQSIGRKRKDATGGRKRLLSARFNRSRVLSFQFDDFNMSMEGAGAVLHPPGRWAGEFRCRLVLSGSQAGRSCHQEPCCILARGRDRKVIRGETIQYAPACCSGILIWKQVDPGFDCRS